MKRVRFTEGECEYLTKGKWYDVVASVARHGVDIINDMGDSIFVFTPHSNHTDSAWESEQ